MQKNVWEPNYDDLVDIVVGSSIFASGGGGSEQDALEIAKRIFKKGYQPRIVDGKSLKDRDLVFSTTDVGGGVAKEVEERFERIYKQKIPMKWNRFPLEKWSPVAIKELAVYLGKNPDCYLCLELGPRFIEVLEHACVGGKPMIDGDTTGRAVPELPMSSLYLRKIPCIAGASTSHFGDVMLLKQVMDYRRMDDIVRSFAIASGGGAGLCIALNGRDTKKALLYGTLSDCLMLGRSVKMRANEKSTEYGLVKAISTETHGKLIFKGRVVGKEVQLKDGFLYGTHILRGVGENRNSEMRIWFKNENHIAWADGKPRATSPDIISIVDPQSGLGLWNQHEMPRDRDLYVFGIPCPKLWRSKKAMNLLSPKAFGFSDIEYTPL